MNSSWAISPELHLELRGHRIRRALEEALRDAVRGGRLVAGERLPSTRALAADLGIARNTVAEAYGQLCAEGWLQARQGSGTRVSAVGLSGHERVPPPCQPTRALRFDLRPGSPDLSSFPRQAWLAAARRAFSEAPDHLLGYGDARGVLPLREALAGYLARVRGVRATPDRIVVCAGFTQALALVSRAMARSGARRIALEGHGLPANRETVAAAGLAVVGVPVDDEGADLSHAADVAAAVVTPAHQFPLGSVMSPGRRSSVVAWARANSGVVIEDDYDGEFRFDRHPVGALQGLAPDRVVYAGTASKTLAPGVRLGWLVVPDDLVDAVVAEKEVADRQSGVLDQLILAELITSGRYDRHVRRRRVAYRLRRDRLVDTVLRASPRSEIRGISAGLHALVTLPDGLDEDSAIAAGSRKGVAVQALAGHRLAGAPTSSRPPALVVGYATPPDHAYGPALERLAQVLAQR